MNALRPICRLLLVMWLGLPAAGAATPPASVPELISQELAQARLAGQGLYRYWGFAIYDARLWLGASAPDFDDLAASPLALELQYRRDFAGDDIARRSLDEMASLGHEAVAGERNWLQAMRETFPDVKAGDRLLGVIDAKGATRFFHNGRPVGSILDREFSHAFFSIWLSPASPAPELRAALLPEFSRQRAESSR